MAINTRRMKDFAPWWWLSRTSASGQLRWGLGRAAGAVHVRGVYPVRTGKVNDETPTKLTLKLPWRNLSNAPAEKLVRQQAGEPLWERGGFVPSAGMTGRVVSSPFYPQSRMLRINIFMAVRACHHLGSLLRGGAWAHTESSRGGEGPYIVQFISQRPGLSRFSGWPCCPGDHTEVHPQQGELQHLCFAGCCQHTWAGASGPGDSFLPAWQPSSTGSPGGPFLS